MVEAHERHLIAAVLEKYRRGFATLERTHLTAIWDHDYDNIIYIAQERAEPLWGWAAVEHYYASVLTQLVRVNTMTISDVVIDVVGDLAYAFCSFHFEGEVAGQDTPRVADGRTTFVLHRKAAMWKVIHYHESRPGPFTALL